MPDLRKQTLSRRDRLPTAHRHILSRHITYRLEHLREYKTARLPLFFISFRSEVSTREIILSRLLRGRPVVVPRTDISKRRLELFLIRDWKKDIVAGAYGIPEPDAQRCKAVTPGNIDLVIVPGSVFDLRCGRFGYGGGYYDRFLSTEAPDAVRVALAFDFQVRPAINTKTHDEPMDMIITESRIIRCSP